MQPSFRIIAEGADITARISDRLVSVSVIDQVGTKSDAIVITLDDRAPHIQQPRHGAILECAMGYDGALVSIGKYTVDSIEMSMNPDQLVIRGHAADFRKSLKESRTKSWDAATLGGIVASMASNHGLQSVVAPDLAAIAFDHTDQVDESDLNFLIRLVKEHDGFVSVKTG
ncbi:MAG: phage late control D family protein, partial [Pseudomonadota bacterium]